MLIFVPWKPVVPLVGSVERFGIGWFRRIVSARRKEPLAMDIGNSPRTGAKRAA